MQWHAVDYYNGCVIGSWLSIGYELVVDFGCVVVCNNFGCVVDRRGMKLGVRLAV